MPDWVIQIMLGIFAIHLIVFGNLAIKRRQAYYVVVSFTFVMLVIAFSLRLWAPELKFGNVSAFWVFRITSWCSAAVGLSMFVRRKLRARAQAQQDAAGSPST